MPHTKRRESALGTAALVVAVSIAPSLALAQGAPQTVVVIAQQGADPLTERAIDAVCTGLADLPISLVTERIVGWEDAIANRVDRARGIAARTGAIAVIWLDLSAPQHVFLFISDPAGGRILVRNVRAETQDVEAQLETLSLIVRGSVKGLLAGGQIGVELPRKEGGGRADVERFGTSLGYALQLFAPTEPVTHGARIELNVGLSRWLFLFAALRLNLPVKASSREVAVDLWTHPIEFGLFGRFRFSKWSLDAGLAAVVDVVTFDVTSRDEAVDAIEPESQVTAGICPFLRVARSLRPVVAVFFSVGMDIEAYNNRYIVLLDETPKTIIQPWRLRPMFELGVRFTVL
jgi:hypothetical protein